MNKFSTAICAIACVFSTVSMAQATESMPVVSTQSNIDNVLKELSRKQLNSSSILQSSSDPDSLVSYSSLINKTSTLANATDDFDPDKLSHLTLVASNAVRKFKQNGLASWYGGKFHGRKTASGERFNMNSMTAAHPSLPFNTYLKVTNKNNGQSVVVKVNDRGPFSGKRVLDLSYGAAKKIGLVKKGVANISMERISAP